MERTITLSKNKYVYELSRRSKRNVNIRVSREGKLLVSAPKALPIWRIEEVIRANEAFVLDSLRRVQTTERPNLENGGFVYLLGERCPVTVTPAGRNGAEEKDGGLIFQQGGILPSFGRVRRSKYLIYLLRREIGKTDKVLHVSFHPQANLFLSLYIIYFPAATTKK